MVVEKAGLHIIAKSIKLNINSQSTIISMVLFKHFLFNFGHIVISSLPFQQFMTSLWQCFIVTITPFITFVLLIVVGVTAESPFDNC